MLWIKFINDGTGDEKIGNYNYEVRVNKQIIERGRVENHLREYGWQALVRQMLVKPILEE